MKSLYIAELTLPENHPQINGIKEQLILRNIYDINAFFYF